MDINYFSCIPFWISIIESWISILIVNFEYPLLNCKSISVIDSHNIHNWYMYIHDIFMDTYHTSMAMGKGLGRLIQYNLRTGRPLVKWLGISSKGFHPEQPTGHTATVSGPMAKLPSKFESHSSETYLRIAPVGPHSDRIYSIWLSFIISMINYVYTWLIKGFIHIFLSIIDLLSSNLVALMTWGPMWNVIEFNFVLI